MMTRKQTTTMLAAPFLAAVAVVCQPVIAEDRALDRAANGADRALNEAGNELNRAADRTAGAAGDASTAVRGGAEDARAQVAGARQQGNKDQVCAAKIADVNNFEIQAGRLAQQKAQRDEIKQFAQMMIDDHTQAQQQLQQIAQRKGMQLPSQLMPVHQAMLTELSQLDGQDFERAYLYGQIAGHTKTALKLRDDKSELQDPELRQYAATILPKVQAHLQHGQRLANADEATTAGARIEGSRDAGGSSSSSDNAGQERSGAGATDRLRPGAGASRPDAGSSGGGAADRDGR